MKIKLMKDQDTPLRRFRKSTFVFCTESMVCNSCLRQIQHEEYANICCDFMERKVWCDQHYNPDHEKVSWFTKIGYSGKPIYQHPDYFCIVKIVPQEIFDQIEEPFIEFDKTVLTSAKTQQEVLQEAENLSSEND